MFPYFENLRIVSSAQGHTQGVGLRVELLSSSVRACARGSKIKETQKKVRLVGGGKEKLRV